MTDLALPSARARSAPAPAPWTLRLGERWRLGIRLTLSMLAGGLLLIAVGWRLTYPAELYLANLVAGIAALLVAVPVFAAAGKSLWRPSLHGVTDQLVALALIAAWATGDLMTAALLPIVMVIGHVLEERSLLGSTEAIRALGRLVEVSARRIRADGGIVELPADQLAVGDMIEVRAGDRVPADGIIRDGATSLDMASLTGESVPVELGVGGEALAGSINLHGRLVIEVVRTAGDTTLGRIITLMHEAEQVKPPVTRLLERYAGQYITLVLMIAAGVWFASADTAAALAVLVASCPCALVLAAPATAIAAIAVAARHGILIKGSAFLENLAEVTSVVFDKTGTVTLGALKIVGVETVPGESEAELLALAATLGATSSHPVSRAVAHAAPPASIELENVQETQGFGVTAAIGHERVALGRAALFASLGIAATLPPDHDGPIVGVSCGARFLGWILLADEPRPEASGALQELRDLGLERQVLLTGDRASVARAIGHRLGIATICADALPEQKMARVQQEIEDGFRPLVVGDGINDALALKVGAVGVAMGAQGTDVALASADLVLMSNDLRRLATGIRLSRRCRRTIHLNVIIGLGWTVILIGLAASGLLGSQGAVIAAVVHNLSTFAGMANAGRLLLFDETGRPPSGASLGSLP
ncbi:MAG: cadmium-translocating P-type ATPase [Alphaproteobacteria bacterium]|nr:cadmium-translocating P-type ATPase [Alphaproteobacteria bacterium]